MNNLITWPYALQALLIASVFVVFILVICIFYLLYNYRKILNEYSDLLVKTDRSEVRKKIEGNTNRYVTQTIDHAVGRAIEEATELIAKNAQNVAKTMRTKTIEKLKAEEKGEEIALAKEYEEADDEIKKYKEKKFEEINQNAKEILRKLSTELVVESLNKGQEETLILKALEDAKRSNLL